MTRYRTIVVDPPWNIMGGSRWNPDNRSRPLPYPTMTVDEIKALPVSEIADVDAYLYLWTINAYVEQAYSVARSWGFKPSTLLTWCKAPQGLGLGGAFSITTEYILFCRRGHPRPLRRIDSTWWLWKRGAHSQKPEAFIDLVEQVSPPPYVELFARRQRLGWSTWGNECFDTAGFEGVHDESAHIL